MQVWIIGSSPCHRSWSFCLVLRLWNDETQSLCRWSIGTTNWAHKVTCARFHTQCVYLNPSYHYPLLPYTFIHHTAESWDKQTYKLFSPLLYGSWKLWHHYCTPHLIYPIQLGSLCDSNAGCSWKIYISLYVLVIFKLSI